MTEEFGATAQPSERRSTIFPRPPTAGPPPAKAPAVPASEALVSALLDGSSAPVAILAPTGEVARTNAPFDHQFVLRTERLAGQPFVECLLPASREAAERSLGRLRKGESRREEMDAFLRASDSHQPAVRLTLVPIREADSLAGVVVTVRERRDPLPPPVAPPVPDEYYQFLFAGNPVPMYICDLETLRFLDVNEAMVRQYGYTRDEFLSITLKDIRPPDEVPRLLRSLDVFRDHHYPPTPWIHRHKDGTLFLMEVTTHVIRYAGRRCRLALTHEVTERVRAQRAVEEREQTLRTIGDNLPGGAIYQVFVESDGKRRFVHCSAGIERILGLSPADIVEDSARLYSLIHPDDLPSMIAAENDAIARHRPFDWEFRTFTTDGRVRHLHCRSAPRALEDGTVRWDGIVLDVTEEKRNRETLRDREALLRAIGDNLPGGAIYRYVMPAGAVGSYTYVSQGIARMCQFTPEDLTSGRVLFRDWMNETDQKRMAAAAMRSTETFESVNEEVRMALPDGAEPIWQWRAVPYRLADGGVGWDGLILDVTDQRQLESQVQQAQKFQTISVLAGGIAHDFNNLLTGILGFADLAAMELRPDDPVHEYMLSIVHSSQRAADLCQQMLAYAGQGRYLVGPIQLTHLVREMVPLLKTVISKSAELRFELDDGLPTFQGDATQIRQIVLNLLTNASEALPESGGVIFLRTGVVRADREFFQSTVLNEQLPEGDYVFLEVEDTGSGMTADTLKQIFDPFFTTKFKGRGLGLAALLGIVRSHRGSVRVTSEWGMGSAFRTVFPIQDASKEA